MIKKSYAAFTHTECFTSLPFSLNFFFCAGEWTITGNYNLRNIFWVLKKAWVCSQKSIVKIHYIVSKTFCGNVWIIALSPLFGYNIHTSWGHLVERWHNTVEYLCSEAPVSSVKPRWMLFQPRDSDPWSLACNSEYTCIIMLQVKHA